MSNSAKKREKVQRKAAAKALEAMRTEQTNKEISKAKLEEDILLPPAIDSDNESDKFSAFDTPYSESGDRPAAGADNGDGTFYGSGPLDVHCSKCAAAGLPTEYGHGHRSSQVTYCPVLQLAASKKKSAIDPSLQKIADEVLPANMKSSKSKLPMTEAVRNMEMLTPQDIMTLLVESRCTASQAQMALLAKIPAASSDEREVLQIFISNVSQLAPQEKKAATLLHSIPGALQTNGKLVTLWHAVVKHCKVVNHKQGKQTQKQSPQINLLTGEVTVGMPDQTPVDNTAMFHLAMEHFRHLIRAKDVLSETEMHALFTWLTTELMLGRQLLIIERTMLVMLASMDANMAQELDAMIKTEARHMMMHQTDIAAAAGSIAHDDTDIFRQTASEKKRQKEKDKKAAAKAAATNNDQSPLPLAVPNSESCWYFTNGLACASKLLDAHGVCRYQHLHKQCGMPLPNGGFCKQDHRAADHA